MARRPGSLCKFTCTVCGGVSLVKGGNHAFVCASCRSATGRVSLQYLAHKAVADAIKAGTLQRPSAFACADCGKPADRYDHRDYLRPLDVAPVCRPCNARRGSAENRAAR